VLLDLPPQARPWALKAGLALVPEGYGLLTGDGGEPTLHIVSPDPKSVYQISPRLPIESQKLKITAVAGAGVRDVTIYLDGAPLARLDRPPFEVWWIIAVGKHEVYAEGVDSSGKRVTSEVVEFAVRPEG
jgi:hypothetical protein